MKKKRLKKKKRATSKESGCRTAAAMSDISTMPVLESYMQY